MHHIKLGVSRKLIALILTKMLSFHMFTLAIKLLLISSMHRPLTFLHVRSTIISESLIEYVKVTGTHSHFLFLWSIVSSFYKVYVWLMLTFCILKHADYAFHLISKSAYYYFQRFILLFFWLQLLTYLWSIFAEVFLKVLQLMGLGFELNYWILEAF